MFAKNQRLDHKVDDELINLSGKTRLQLCCRGNETHFLGFFNTVNPSGSSVLGEHSKSLQSVTVFSRNPACSLLCNNSLVA